MSIETEIGRIPRGPPRSLARQHLFLAADDDDGLEKHANDSDCILIIEDDLLIASQMEAALTEAGFEIVGVATTGEEALEVAATRRPALAVVDIRLAGDRDGVDTALELFRSHGIRCIFASAYSDLEARRRAEPAAPLGWLQKPYSMTSLTTIVRQAAKDLRDQRRS